MSLLYSQANTQRHELELLPKPVPMGPRHKPYPFAQYVNDVEEGLDRIGWEINAQEYELDEEGKRLFGALEIAPRTVSGEVLSEEEYRVLVGLRGSHDQSVSRGLVLGNKIMVCSNLMFSGNIASFNTKQTTNIVRRLPRLINDAIGHIPEMAQAQHDKLERYKEYEFSNPRDGDAALVEIFRQGGLSAAQLGKAVKEWDEPTYEEHARFGKSAYLLLNSVTEALKPGGQNVNHNLIAQRTEIADRFLQNLTVH